ncbi:MAG: NAD(P)-dependent oxidoreductase [Chloroflexi bacterium]|nr:NAD(P)-dependent oxidoreductase [Chloroflexota bacterium]MDA1297005.1 NAD(P)-dependent oxidoreductase [Chloroflexota bacterium]
MAETQKAVLVTGMSGIIGGVAGRDLAKSYRVSALNRRPVEGFETVTADITDLNAIRPAFEGVDTVVHMAAYLGGDDQQQLEVNVRGTHNVFQAARESGVRRIVFGSSGSTMHAYETEEPFLAMTEARLANIPHPRPLLTHLDPPRPDSLYGAVKLFGEALGRSFAEQHGISVICVRLGRVRAEDRPANAREAAVYLSHRDAAQVVRRCVEAPDSVKFDIVFGVSDNFTRFRDLEHAREVIGYVPEDGIKEWPLPEGWKAAG